MQNGHLWEEIHTLKMNEQVFAADAIILQKATAQTQIVSTSSIL